ncbi:hypothetical protein Acr_13g0007140 [Actinidia rufa]|uniref:Tify domain-containing protein n=1 Tax=Actinidia rufa TaxID=165716 RepID=A0A7J0FL61_9ERIC|nr:hypothetical protein Acr_13g0007140 [Actinidia rufa]
MLSVYLLNISYILESDKLLLFSCLLQSFHNKGFWLAEGVGHLTHGDTPYDNPSRIEPKRPHQWFADTEQELSPNKKQAVQAPNSNSATGTLNANAPPWGNTSGAFPSVPSQFMDRLFGDDTNRPFSFTEQNISPVGLDDSNLRRKGVNEQYGNDSSVGWSISQTMEDPEICLGYGGSRKVKVNQVKDSVSGLHAPEQHNSNVGQAYSPGNETGLVPMGKGYSKEDGSVMLMGHTYKGNVNIGSMGSTSGKGDEDSISIGHSYSKGEFNTMFDGFQEEPDIDPLVRPLNSYQLIYDQSSVQTSEIPNNELDASIANAIETVSKVAKPRRESASKNKLELKGARKEREAPNSFPWNVKTLISTGILDGVPVKYVSLSGEVLHAHGFERHAGCKTKHPNDHIYFENGKSTYQVVQELRSTPENELFDAIQTVTGSPINQKAFTTWKESFQAATRELQRIYGKEDLNQQ